MTKRIYTETSEAGSAARRPRAKAVRVTLLFAAVLLTAMTARAESRERTVGQVLSVEGDWVVNNTRELKQWSPLPEGGLIELRRRRGGEYIQLADRLGNLLKTINCEHDDCTRSYRLPPLQTDPFSRVFQGAVLLLARNPRAFVVLLSKGGELKEAVVKLTARQADLSDVLANRGRGSYLLQFLPVRMAGRGRAAARISVDWEPGGPALVNVNGLRPGLYEVELLSDEDGGRLGPGTGSRVLFTTPEEFEGASREFGEATALTDSWGAQVPQSVKRQFLRAVLGDLDARLPRRGATREK